MQLRVIIADHTGTKITPVELPDDVPMNILVPALVTKMSFQKTQGRYLIAYVLYHVKSGRRLGDEDTLQSAGVQQGDVLALIPSVIAGCFLAGTHVLMSNKASKPIETLAVQDQVLSYLPDERRFAVGTIEKTFTTIVDSYLVLNHRLKITGSHFVLANGKWMRAEALKCGDRLIAADGSAITVESIESKAERVQVFNLHLGSTTNHTFFAEGILVHNMESKAGLHGDATTEPSLPTLRITAEEINALFEPTIVIRPEDLPSEKH